MLGMLGSRVPKGQSLADRMNRLENHIFDLRKELLSNGMMELTSSFKDDMNEIKDSHASLMDMLRKAGLGDADGILSQLVAMDAANKLKELESLLVCIPCHLSGIFCRLSLHSAASKLAYVLFFCSVEEIWRRGSRFYATNDNDKGAADFYGSNQHLEGSRNRKRT